MSDKHIKHVNRLHTWMQHATPEQQTQLANEASTTRQYLYSLAAGFDKPYRRTPGIDLVERLESSVQALQDAGIGPGIEVDRTDVIPACARCPYALGLRSPRKQGE